MSEGKQGQAAAESRSNAFVVEAGRDRLQDILRVFGDEVAVNISSRDTGGAFAVMEDWTKPMQGPPLHMHHVQDEWWHILEGEYLFEVDGRQFHAGPGATVFAPRGTSHTFQNIGSTTGHTIVTVVPGGLDLFFEEVLAAFPPGSAPEVERLLPIFHKHGLELLGPPLAAREAEAA